MLLDLVILPYYLFPVFLQRENQKFATAMRNGDFAKDEIRIEIDSAFKEEHTTLFTDALSAEGFGTGASLPQFLEIMSFPTCGRYYDHYGYILGERSDNAHRIDILLPAAVPRSNSASSFPSSPSSSSSSSSSSSFSSSSTKRCRVPDCSRCRPDQSHFCVVCGNPDSDHRASNCPKSPNNTSGASSPLMSVGDDDDDFPTLPIQFRILRVIRFVRCPLQLPAGVDFPGPQYWNSCPFLYMTPAGAVAFSSGLMFLVSFQNLPFQVLVSFQVSVLSRSF